jgi:hypothetical protein
VLVTEGFNFPVSKARKTRPSRRAAMILAMICVLAVPSGLSAQPSRVTLTDFATGSEFEEYLRVLQVAGIAPVYPWSIRGFSADEVGSFVASDSTGPWKLKTRFRSSTFDLGTVTTTERYNSSYPYGANDGPVRAGPDHEGSRRWRTTSGILPA